MLDRLWKLLCQRRSVQLFVVIACLAWPATCVWHRLTRPGEAQLLRQARRLASRGERSFREEGRARDAEAAWLKAVELSSDAWPDPHEALLKLYAVQLRAPEIRRELEAIGRFREWKLTELYQLVNATGEAVNRGDAIPRLERFTLADPGDVHSLVALGRYYLWDERQDDA